MPITRSNNQAPTPSLAAFSPALSVSSAAQAACPARDYHTDVFETPRIPPPPFHFGPTTSAESFGGYLNVLHLPSKKQAKELSLRLFSLLRDPSFEHKPLCLRGDLNELYLHLEALREQPTSISLLNRLRGRDADGRALLSDDNFAKLNEALKRVSKALEQQRDNSVKLAAVLSKTPLDEAELARLVNNGGRIREGRENYIWQLMCRVLTGTPETIALLARAGLDFNQPDREGRRPLHWAVQRGDPDSVKAVLEAGADPNLPDIEGYAPLHLKSSPAIITALIEGGANPDLPTTNGASSPLLVHTRRASLPEVVALLLKRADPNLPDKFGATPLLEARKFKLVEIERALLQYGATDNANTKR